MIDLQQVTAHRGRQVALRDVTLRIEPGTVTAVVGPNGAGKSTLFGLISGRLRPTEGTVVVDGDVAEVLQATSVDSQVRLTVHDVVCMGRYPTCGHLRRFRPADRAAVADALTDVGLDGHARRSLDELSGGQRQRAILAQGIAQDAPILLLDEPASGLDRPSQQRVLDVIRAQADRGRTVLFSTHHLPDATHADQVIALACECICCAPPDTVFADPGVRALFDPLPPTRAAAPDRLVP